MPSTWKYVIVTLQATTPSNTSAALVAVAGDMDSQQQRRRSNTLDGDFDGTEDDFQDLSLRNSAVVIPVSTHASIGPRVSSPAFETSSASSKQWGCTDEQQQRPTDPTNSLCRKAAHDALVFNADGSGVKQRLSIEMSSIDGSGGSPSSIHNSIEVPLGFRVGSPAADMPAAASEKSSSQHAAQLSHDGRHNRYGSIADSADVAGQQQLTDTKAVDSGSPVRLKAVVPVARLGQQSRVGHYSD